MTLAEETDVLIVGAGPVGLLLALNLAQQGIDTVVIEKRTLQEQSKLGRACTLYPRTMELLDVLGVADPILQKAFISRSYAVYSGGKRVSRKTFQTMFHLMDESFHNYVTNVRQNKSELVIREKYHSDHGKIVNYGWKFQGQEPRGDGSGLSVQITNDSNEKRTIRCKYLIGADGGNSSVRRHAGIEMEGSDTTYRWVRLDGLFKTNIPEPDVSFAALETQTHGNVLWVKLDGDAHRIGFALTPALQAKYPDGPNEEQVREEAVAALKPFDLDIQRLDWHTYYAVKQKVAQTFHQDRILLAGDAAHTHSSAYAQGMNTGVHDALNLGFKLAGVLKGWYKPEVLSTYAQERKAVAQQLIDIDKMAAQAVSGDIPSQHKAMGLSNLEAFQQIMRTNMSFTIGLGIIYEQSILCKSPLASTLVAGMRSPDALILPQGPPVPVRLHSITHKSQGRWSMLVFAGTGHTNQKQLASLRSHVETSDWWRSQGDKVALSTLIVGPPGNAWKMLGGPSFGNAYFDSQMTAHDRFGIAADTGGLAVIRPDGVFAFGAEVGDMAAVEAFFDAIFV